jgi:hypothetical protein
MNNWQIFGTWTTKYESLQSKLSHVYGANLTKILTIGQIQVHIKNIYIKGGNALVVGLGFDPWPYKHLTQFWVIIRLCLSLHLIILKNLHNRNTILSHPKPQDWNYVQPLGCAKSCYPCTTNTFVHACNERFKFILKWSKSRILKLGTPFLLMLYYLAKGAHYQ